MTRSSAIRDKALLYVLVGGLAALIDLSVFQWMHLVVGHIFVAAAASFAVAAVFNYLLASLIVYRTRLSTARAISFFAGAGFGLMVNASITAVLMGVLACPPMFAKASGIAVAFGVNFAVNTFAVFRR